MLAARVRFVSAIAVSLLLHAMLLGLFRAEGGSRSSASGFVPIEARLDAVILPVPLPVLREAEPPKLPVPARAERSQRPAPVAVPPASSPAVRKPEPAASDSPPLARGVPEPSDIESVEQYRLALIFSARRLARPAITGATGRVGVALTIGTGGLLRGARIVGSSGDERLDAAAVELLTDAHARQPTPIALAGREFTVTVTVEF